MPKTFLIIGHTGFIGKSFLSYLNSKYPESKVFGIAKSEIDPTLYPFIDIKQSSSMEEFNTPDNYDYVFFLAHAQNSDRPTKEEQILTDAFINLIKRNKISSPIVLILSAGNGSNHLDSRVKFNSAVKLKLQNRIIEIKTSVIASPGSISYEIPYRCVNRLNILPTFPWYKSKVSLTTIQNILLIFERIIGGEKCEIYYPEYYTTTYGDYIQKIASEQNKKIKYIYLPINEFRITPYIVSKITGLPRYLVRNLMKSLAVQSVIK